MTRLLRSTYMLFLIMLSSLLLSCGDESSTGPEKTGHTVTGRVVDASGAGLPGVRVTLSGSSDDYSALTGDNGIYTIKNVAEGMYIVSCAGEDFRFIIPNDEITVDGVVTIPLITAFEPISELFQFVTIPAVTDPYVMNPDGGGDFSVTLSSYEMSTTQVTNAQYAQYLTEALASGDITATSSSVKGASGDWSGQEYLDLDSSSCQISYSGGTFTVDSGVGNRPVVEVTWYGAKSFAEYYGLDLPTEAEWQYAASGGKNYGYGTDDGTINSSKANYDRNVGHTTDVGSYPANPFGLYDMAGNVWECCHDWYGSYPGGNRKQLHGCTLRLLPCPTRRLLGQRCQVLSG